MIIITQNKRSGKTEKIKRMEGFIDWYQNKVKAIHPISNESFINILEKI